MRCVWCNRTGRGQCWTAGISRVRPRAHPHRPWRAASWPAPVSLPLLHPLMWHKSTYQRARTERYGALHLMRPHRVGHGRRSTVSLPPSMHTVPGTLCSFMSVPALGPGMHVAKGARVALQRVTSGVTAQGWNRASTRSSRWCPCSAPTHGGRAAFLFVTVVLSLLRQLVCHKNSM